jgi:hypothetical protein
MEAAVVLGLTAAVRAIESVVLMVGAGLVPWLVGCDEQAIRGVMFLVGVWCLLQLGLYGASADLLFWAKLLTGKGL